MLVPRHSLLALGERTEAVVSRQRLLTPGEVATLGLVATMLHGSSMWCRRGHAGSATSCRQCSSTAPQIATGRMAGAADHSGEDALLVHDARADTLVSRPREPRFPGAGRVCPCSARPRRSFRLRTGRS